MCELSCQQYARPPRGCGHNFASGILRCRRSLVTGIVCTPQSGRVRDLPRNTDVQDMNLSGQCPQCLGLTPPSSEGSEIALVLGMVQISTSIKMGADVSNRLSRMTWVLHWRRLVNHVMCRWLVDRLWGSWLNGSLFLMSHLNTVARILWTATTVNFNSLFLQKPLFPSRGNYSL